MASYPPGCSEVTCVPKIQVYLNLSSISKEVCWNYQSETETENNASTEKRCVFFSFHCIKTASELCFNLLFVY